MVFERYYDILYTLRLTLGGIDYETKVMDMEHVADFNALHL